MKDKEKGNLSLDRGQLNYSSEPTLNTACFEGRPGEPTDIGLSVPAALTRELQASDCVPTRGLAARVLSQRVGGQQGVVD